MKIFGTPTASKLASDICELLDVNPGHLHCKEFADGEVFVRFEESIRGESVVIVAQPQMPYKNLFELFLTVDAARRASAKEVILVVPYLPHSRQERKESDRSSIAARLIADFIQDAGADRLITLDLHTSSIEGFYKIPVDHLEAVPIIQDHIDQSGLENLCLCSPDFGGLKRVKRMSKALGCDFAIINKERTQANQVNHMEIIGDIRGRDIVMVDDMVDTGGTLCRAANELREKGAKSVVAYTTHGLLSGQAQERIQASALERLYITNSVTVTLQTDKISVLDCTPMLANAIQHLVRNKSLKNLSTTLSYFKN